MSLRSFTPPAALALAALLALAGCDGDDGSGDRGVPDLGAVDDGRAPDTRAIAGLYDASYLEFGEEDEVNVDIGVDGTWTEYDFEGDAFDAGPNCYSIVEYRVTPLPEGDRYRIDGPGEFEGGREAVLRRVATTLRVTFADDDGDVANSVTEIWELIEGRSPVDFTPC